MKKNSIFLINSCLLAITLSAQEHVYDFNAENVFWNVEKGNAEIREQGVHNKKALRLSANTRVVIRLPLEQASGYKVIAWMRTESGADNIDYPRMVPKKRRSLRQQQLLRKSQRYLSLSPTKFQHLYP